MNLWTHWKKSVLKLRLNIQSAVIPTDKLPKRYKHMKIDTTEKQSYRPGQSLIRIRCVRIAEPNSVFKETGSVTKTHTHTRGNKEWMHRFFKFIFFCCVESELLLISGLHMCACTKNNPKLDMRLSFKPYDIILYNKQTKCYSIHIIIIKRKNK